MTDDVSPVSDLIGEGQALGIKVKKSGPKYNFSMAFSGALLHRILQAGLASLRLPMHWI